MAYRWQLQVLTVVMAKAAATVVVVAVPAPAASLLLILQQQLLLLTLLLTAFFRATVQVEVAVAVIEGAALHVEKPRRLRGAGTAGATEDEARL